MCLYIIGRPIPTIRHELSPYRTAHINSYLPNIIFHCNTNLHLADADVWSGGAFVLCYGISKNLFLGSTTREDIDSCVTFRIMGTFNVSQMIFKGPKKPHAHSGGSDHIAHDKGHVRGGVVNSNTEAYVHLINYGTHLQSKIQILKRMF